jgi:hypothetical protein
MRTRFVALKRSPEEEGVASASDPAAAAIIESTVHRATFGIQVAIRPSRVIIQATQCSLQVITDTLLGFNHQSCRIEISKPTLLSTNSL